MVRETFKITKMNQISTKAVIGNHNGHGGHDTATSWCAKQMAATSNLLLKKNGVKRIISTSFSIICSPDMENRGYTASVIITYEEEV